MRRRVLGLRFHDQRGGGLELIEAPGVHALDGLESGVRVHRPPAELLGERATPEEIDVRIE
eukprot:2082734-Lingulodinium_polyedra.AAC.1